MNYMERAFAPITAEYRARVAEDTWGHLAPRKNKTYRGHVLFAFGCFGSDPLNATVLECEIGLDSSPWFFEALTEFLGTFGGDESAGAIFRWEGTFRNYEFKGKVRRAQISVASAAL